jgi:hypothetical protein
MLDYRQHTSMQMSHRLVAAQTGDLPAGQCRMRWLDGADNLPVAVTTGLLGYLPAVRFDLNIVLVAARGEEKRMPEAVGRFRRILANEVCRGVATVAVGHRPVRRFEPAVELFAHNVAVGASRRVIREVGPTLGIGESIDTDANGNTDNNSKQDALNGVNLHLDCLRRIASGSNLPRALRRTLYWGLLSPRE